MASLFPDIFSPLKDALPLNFPATPLLSISELLNTHVSETTTSTLTHFLSLTLLVTLPLITIHTLYNDYQAFLSLGPGGTPPTPLGYLKIKLLSIVSLRNPYRAPSIPSHFRPQTGYFNATSLPLRQGKRPVIQGIAPQRQRSEKSSPEIYKELCRRIAALTQNPANALIEHTSCFEKHSTGLFTSAPLTNTCRGEICHAHPSDGSMHLVLHPADIRVLIERGWGERHPLARGGWFRRFVPREFVMVYAPRDKAEVDIAIEVIAAAVWWVGGIDIKGGEGSRQVVEVHGGHKDSHARRKGGECWSCGSGTTEKMVGSA